MRTYIMRSRRERTWELVGLGALFGLLIAFTVATVCAGPVEQPVRGHWQDIEGAVLVWALAFSCLYLVLAMPFEARLADDGSVTFRSLLKVTGTSAREITKICCGPISPGLTRWPASNRAHIMISRLRPRSRIAFCADPLSFHSFIAAVYSLNPAVELWQWGTGSLGLGVRQVSLDELWEEA